MMVRDGQMRPRYEGGPGWYEGIHHHGSWRKIYRVLRFPYDPDILCRSFP